MHPEALEEPISVSWASRNISLNWTIVFIVSIRAFSTVNGAISGKRSSFHSWVIYYKLCYTAKPQVSLFKIILVPLIFLCVPFLKNQNLHFKLQIVETEKYISVEVNYRILLFGIVINQTFFYLIPLPTPFLSPSPACTCIQTHVHTHAHTHTFKEMHNFPLGAIILYKAEALEHQIFLFSLYNLLLWYQKRMVIFINVIFMWLDSS